MPDWIWTLALTGAAAAASASGAAALARLNARRLERLIPALVSFSVGVLLGAACLDLLPGAFADAAPGRAVNLGLTLALGILTFFALEKAIHWHHAHDVDVDVDAAADARRNAADRATTVMVLMGTSLHNALAGILLAAAVLTNHKTALILFAAVLAHHVPQQIGDLSVLMLAGVRRRRALVLTVASSAVLLAGGVAAFFVLRAVQGILPFILAVASASLIYIASADLIPRLRHASGGRQSLAAVALVALGIGVIYAVTVLLPA